MNQFSAPGGEATPCSIEPQRGDPLPGTDHDGHGKKPVRDPSQFPSPSPSGSVHAICLWRGRRPETGGGIAYQWGCPRCGWCRRS